MGLEKFLDLIANSYLRFTRSSLLSDQYELGMPLQQKEDCYWETGKQYKDKDSYLSQMRAPFEELEILRRRIGDLRDRVYLSSWSIGSHESYALWKIYLGGAAGVAIKSTVSSVISSFIMNKYGKPNIQVGEVKYSSDFAEKEDLDDLDFILNKTEIYKYEQELRIFVITEPPKASFFETRKNPSTDELLHQRIGPSRDLALGVDLNHLIHEVYLSPFMIQHFGRTLNTIIKKLTPDLNFPICQSSVRDR